MYLLFFICYDTNFKKYSGQHCAFESKSLGYKGKRHSIETCEQSCETHIVIKSDFVCQNRAFNRVLKIHIMSFPEL